MRSPYRSNIPSARHLLYILSVTSASSNSESPVPLSRTTWKACHGDTGTKLTYESPPPSSTWPYRASCGDTDLLKPVTFVCTDWEEAILPFLTSSQWAFSLSAFFLIPVGNIFIHFCSRRLLFGHISVLKCAQKAPSSPFRARLAVFLCQKGYLPARNGYLLCPYLLQSAQSTPSYTCILLLINCLRTIRGEKKR